MAGVLVSMGLQPRQHVLEGVAVESQVVSEANLGGGEAGLTVTAALPLRWCRLCGRAGFPRTVFNGSRRCLARQALSAFSQKSCRI